MFELSDAAWRRLTHGRPIPGGMRTGLQNLGQNYRRFSDVRDRRPRASETRGVLLEVARLSEDLARATERLDEFARAALADVKPGPTPKLDGWTALEDHLSHIRKLNRWCTEAAERVPSDPRGPTARAELVDWLVLGFAHLYLTEVGQPFTAEPTTKQLLGDFVGLLDHSITPRSLDAARQKAITAMQNRPQN